MASISQGVSALLHNMDSIAWPKVQQWTSYTEFQLDHAAAFRSVPLSWNSSSIKHMGYLEKTEWPEGTSWVCSDGDSSAYVTLAGVI